MENLNTNPKTIRLMFGDLTVTNEVEARLENLGFESRSLQEDILYHKSDGTGNPSIYCGTYAKYNDGNYTGQWMDLTTFDDFDEFISLCKAIHADEKDPELMFQDFECFPSEWYSESYFDEKKFNMIKEYIELGEKYSKEAVDAFMLWGCEDLDNFEECYIGEYDCEEDYARGFVEECYDLERMMGNLAQYFDYEAFARDLFYDDYYFDNGYVFRRR